MISYKSKFCLSSSPHDNLIFADVVKLVKRVFTSSCQGKLWLRNRTKCTANRAFILRNSHVEAANESQSQVTARTFSVHPKTKNRASGLEMIKNSAHIWLQGMIQKPFKSAAFCFFILLYVFPPSTGCLNFTHQSTLLLCATEFITCMPPTRWKVHTQKPGSVKMA